MNFKKRISFWFLGSLLLSFHTYATDNLPDTQEQETTSAPKIGVPYSNRNFRGPDPTPSSVYNFLNPADRQTTGAAAFVNNVLDNIQISGTIRLLTIYRNMDKYYTDMQSSPKNISIYDYPLTSVGTNVGGGFPQLEFNMTSRISPRFLFNVGYSFANTMTGGTAPVGSNNTASSRQNLFFNGKINAGAIRFDISAGGVIWSSLSNFTMSQAQYRDSYFNRLPWDWYRNSSLRYEEYYSLSRNIGGQANGLSPLLGFVAKTDILPLGVKITTLYGRTNTNVPVGLFTTHYPSYTVGVRVEKIIFTRYVAGKVGFNYRGKFSEESAAGGVANNQEMYTLDFNLKVRKIRFAGEGGTSMLKNRLIGDIPTDVASAHTQQGYGFSLKAELDRDLTTLPISLEYYHIDKWMVSQDGAIINSNPKTLAQGSDQLYDLFFQQNLAQEIGVLVNNRQGINLKAEKNVGKLKIQFGAAWSKDLTNLGDTVTFQHRVNSFSRSRFHPWFNAGGNYGRLKSNWLRTYEIVTITDKANGISTDYLKGYSAMELFLKYKITLFSRDLILLNYNSYNSVDDHLKVLGTDNSSFIRVFFEDFTASYKLTKKVSVVGNFGLERAVGGDRTQTVSATDNRHINQFGHAYALGVDYDFAKNAGLHIRHTWMDHKDRNFDRDQFKGTETNVELKIFF
ncbi:MAG: hypothetical protein JWO58_2420 [Chitinophagaceae bacterium]|nr:hypothetical protein [Chitinophagaceae bacterium]